MQAKAVHMKSLRILLAVFLLVTASGLYAQQRNREFLLSKEYAAGNKPRPYAAFVHQHQNFFGEAFSFQAIEAGVLFPRGMFLNASGAFFASNLHIDLQGEPMYVSIKQVTAGAGRVFWENKKVHPGALLNAGCFSLHADKTDVSVFKKTDASLLVHGWTCAPQIFAEFNVVKWMKFRPGIAWNFYGFENTSRIRKSDLQNGSVNFAFIFGKFN